MLLGATGSTNGPCLQAGRWDSSSAAADELTPGKEQRQTRLTSIHLCHSWNRKQDPSPQLSPTNCSHLPLNHRKGEMHTASHKAREGKQPRGTTERRPNNTVCKEYKGNKSLQAESRLLAIYVGWFCPRSHQYQKPQLFWDKKDNQIIPASEKREGWWPETSNDYPERCQAARGGKGSTLQSQDAHPPPARAEQPKDKSHRHQWQVRLTPLPLCP